ncbi:MAG: hypothetical protein LM580_03330 [Thermofilum sp.]|nr:hypothetical protein [Thermofilum sp.]
MAEKARILVPATLLILLAVASFAAALITITNITEWHVYAKTPPIVKVDGKLMGYNYGKYVNVTNYFAEDGTNRTVISVLGFTGDPVKYDNVLFICNKDYQGYTYNVQLVYKGLLYDTTWDYVQYIRLYFPDSTNVLYIDGSTTGTPSTGPRIIPPDTCDTVSVEVLVKPDAPADGSTRLIAIQVDVVAIKP